MNAKQRKELDRIYSALEGLRNDIESIKDEESEKADNMEESFSGTERAERQREVADYLDTAYNGFDEIMDAIESAKE